MLDVWIMAPTQRRCEWLARSLTSDESIRVAGTASTFPILRSQIADGFADVILVDLPSQGTGTTLEWLNELEELAAVVVLVPEHDREIFQRILQRRSGSMLAADTSPE